MSNTTMWGVAGLCRAFLSALSTAEVHGGEAFTALLDSRKDPSQRTKGLITGKSTRALLLKDLELEANQFCFNSVEPYQRVRAFVILM